MIPPFARIKHVDRVTQQLQTNAGATLDPLAANALVNGTLVSFTATSAIPPNTDFTVGHGLGRSPLGILAGIVAAQSSFQISPTANNAPASTMILRSQYEIPANSSFTFLVF